MKDDKTLDFLLDLDGQIIVINADIGLWVKFEAKHAPATKNRPHGIRYSLSLHDRHNRRIMGFDNAHAIEYGGKVNVAPKRTHYHWHKNASDQGRPYEYSNAGKLVEDFWSEVEKIELKMLETKKR